MIYLFLLLVAVAIALFKLGSMSVWLTVLSWAFVAVYVVVMAIAVFVIGRWFRRKLAITHSKPNRKP